jgi:hypothetical protein
MVFIFCFALAFCKVAGSILVAEESSVGPVEVSFALEAVVFCFLLLVVLRLPVVATITFSFS